MDKQIYNNIKSGFYLDKPSTLEQIDARVKAYWSYARRLGMDSNAETFNQWYDRGLFGVLPDGSKPGKISAANKTPGKTIAATTNMSAGKSGYSWPVLLLAGLIGYLIIRK